MKRTVLFADDEYGIRQICKTELEFDGYRVLIAKNGEEAIQLASTFQVDVAVLDRMMPSSYDSWKTATHLKRWFPHLPIVLFTSDIDIKKGSLRELYDAVVAKSAELSSLKTAIRACCSQRLDTHAPSLGCDGDRDASISN